jgi:hypothetical protein
MKKTTQWRNRPLFSKLELLSKRRFVFKVYSQERQFLLWEFLVFNFLKFSCNFKSVPMVYFSTKNSHIQFPTQNHRLQKQTRRLDFIQWARQIGMRALALGKRYVGVSFELHSIRSRLYLFFVEEPETHGMDLAEGRNGLNTKIRDLFDKLKAEDTAQRSV